MVDMLGRAGLLDEAFEFIESMEIEPNALIWRTLLGACRIHGNVELGKRANERLIKMRRDQSGDYVLLSNIFSSKGEWDGVDMVRKTLGKKTYIPQAANYYHVKEHQDHLSPLRSAPYDVKDRERERKQQIAAYNGIGNHKETVIREAEV
ncbi:hypothetical protein CRYUN_Cryun17cG0035800 [Craigia yunnanensis]